jgi:hypothetical protein
VFREAGGDVSHQHAASNCHRMVTRQWSYTRGGNRPLPRPKREERSGVEQSESLAETGRERDFEDINPSFDGSV